MPDSNPDYQINRDPDVCRIAPKMWIHYLVGISHFVEVRENQVVTIGTANEFHKIPYSAMVTRAEN